MRTPSSWQPGETIFVAAESPSDVAVLARCLRYACAATGIMGGSPH